MMLKRAWWAFREVLYRCRILKRPTITAEQVNAWLEKSNAENMIFWTKPAKFEEWPVEHSWMVDEDVEGMSDLSPTIIAKWIGDDSMDTIYGWHAVFAVMRAAHERIWARRLTLYHGYGWWYVAAYLRIGSRMLHLDWRPGRWCRLRIDRRS